MKKIYVIVSTIVLASVFFFAAYKDQPASDNDSQPLATFEGATYESAAYGIAFSYSPDFFVTEKEVGTASSPQYSITLAEDTQEHRDLFAGVTGEAREGPPTVTIDIYPNTQQVNAQEWIEKSTTWTLRTNQVEPTTIGDTPGVSFTWSGLYEGKSVVTATNENIYVFSVTWLDTTSETVDEFQVISNSVQFTNN